MKTNNILLRLQFIVGLIMISNLLIAQAENKNTSNSLKKVWVDESQSDTNRLNAIIEFTWENYLYNDTDSAIYFAELAYYFAQEKGLKTQEIEAIHLLAIAYSFISDIEKTILYYEKYIVLLKEVNNLKELANTYNTIGNICKNIGEYSKSLDYHSKSLKIRVDIQDKKGIADSYNNLGNVYKNMGDYTKSIYFHTESLKIRKETNDKKGISISYNNIGNIYKNTGDYAKAIEYYKESLKIKEELNDKKGIINSLGNIGIICNLQGDHNVALEYYFKSLKLSEEINDKKGKVTILNNIGNVYLDKKDFKKAKAYFNESYKLFEELNDRNGIAGSLFNIGVIHERQSNYKDAFDYYIKSYEMYLESNYPIGISNAMNNIAGIYYLQKNYNKAIEYTQNSLKIAKEIGADKEIKDALYNNYKIYLQIDSIHKTYGFLSELVNRRNKNLKTNFFTLSEREKEIYFNTMEIDYGLYHDFTLFNHDQFTHLTDTSYNIALMTKGITLKSSTAMRFSIYNSNDSLLIQEYENWLDLKKQIAKIYETGGETKEMEYKASEMEKKLVKKSNDFSNFDKIQNLTWKDIQKNIKPKEAAIEFVHFKSEIDTNNQTIYAALIVKKESLHPEIIKLCTEKELENILGVFQGNNQKFVLQTYGNKQSAQSALYNKIWQPMEKSLENIKKVYISPSGLLHKVSFAALSKKSNIYLCDMYEIHQLNSTGKIATNENISFSEKDNFLLMGGVNYNSDTTSNEIWTYLPGTLEETENIYNFLLKKKYSVNYYTLQNASEGKFKTEVQKANILHIATHGFFYPNPEKMNEEINSLIDENESGEIIFRGRTNYANWSFVKNKNPLMRSGIVMAGANDIWNRSPIAEGDDGVLTAQEVSTLDLRNTKLVVLSACETGLGDIKGSEGVFGLQRAFKMAGVKYIIMSLWQVPDKETSEFMQLFYENLINVKNIPKAFNLTQKNMRKKYDPYYWASFVLIE